MIANGILRELPPSPTEIGRPTVPLEVVDKSATFAGFKVQSGQVHSVLIGMRGRVLFSAKHEVETKDHLTTAESIIKILHQIAVHHEIVAIGVSFHAAIDQQGEIRAAHLLGWDGGNLQQHIANKTGLPCTSANDVDALALAEHWFGDGRGVRNFAAIALGEGVGAGVVTGDELMVGHQGSAGMLGELWAPSGRHFHDELSCEGIERRVGQLIGHEWDYREGTNPCEAPIEEELERSAAMLGHLCGLVTLAYGPDRILITGEGIGLVTPRMKALRSAFEDHQFHDVSLPQLVVRQHDHVDWARGAAVLGIKSCLADSIS